MAGSAGGFDIGLKARAEFQRAATGRRYNATSLSLQAFHRPDDTERARFGLTVTKRVGNAVERNRIKRRFRALLRQAGVAAQPGHDYVILARSDALKVPFDELAKDLAKTLDQSRAGRLGGRHRKTGAASAKPAQSS